MNRDVLRFMIKLLLGIAVSSFIIDKAIFFSLNHLSSKVFTGQSVGKINHYIALKDTTKVLIFGSSRANHNVNPNALSASGFNIGVDGTGLAYATTLVKMITSNTNQTLLLHIDPKDAVDANYLGADVKRLAIKYNINDTVRRAINKLGMKNPFQIFFWSLSYNNKVLGVVQNYLRPKYNYHKYNGYDPIIVDSAQSARFKLLLAKRKAVECRDKLLINDVYQNCLKDLANFARQNNKRLVLFTSPLYIDDCKEDNIALASFTGQLGLTYYDYSDMFPQNSDLSYWKDEIHLGSKGAELFTAQLKEKLISDNLLP
jgi:hypothetical protein